MRTTPPLLRSPVPRGSLRERSPARAPAEGSAAPTHGGEPAADPRWRLVAAEQPPGYYDANTKTALLRRSNEPPHDELLVDFWGPEVQLELRAAGDTLLRGPWVSHVVAGGAERPAQGKWREVCWHRDDEADYLELELALSGGWRVQRQLLLARQDRFLYLAEAWLAPESSPAVEMHATSSLPLAAACRSTFAGETREGTWLAGRRRRANVLPLALPEWRAEFCHGEAAAQGTLFTLRQAALGRALYAPLFVDLDPQRLRKPLTWRRLTVGEQLAVVPRDVAAAFRVQVGRQQWLFYRSLGPVANRTFLGHNLLSDFACCRFTPQGESKALLEIEA